MKENETHVLEQPKLKNPVLIEGLPGLGLVGRLGAEHLVNELQAKKFAELYSPDFPPQAQIMPDGTLRMRRNEFYYWKAEKKSQRDLIILVGDDQGLTVQSQYALCGSILDIAEEHGCRMIYTLGGYGMQRMAKEPRVFGAVTDKKMTKEFFKYGVEFEKVSGAIVGVAGLLLGLGQLRGMRGICLMGETHGNYIDPRAAKSVLRVVCESLDLKIKLDGLDKKASEVEEMIKRLENIQKAQQPDVIPAADSKNLTYIR
ncbi:MAG: proteasome assembly chaperone family protein [archaeon]